MSVLISVIIAVTLGLLYITPHFINKFYFYNPDNITDSDISTCKGLFGAANALLMVSWILASAVNRASIQDMDIDPDEIARGEEQTEAEELTNASI